MPLFRYKLKRSDEAKRDLAEIRTYTIQTWNREQWDVYKQRIEHALQTIATEPALGKSVEHIRPGCFRYHMGRPKGAHYIDYQVKGTTIEVLRFIHDSRDQDRSL